MSIEALGSRPVSLLDSLDGQPPTSASPILASQQMNRPSGLDLRRSSGDYEVNGHKKVGYNSPNRSLGSIKRGFSCCPISPQSCSLHRIHVSGKGQKVDMSVCGVCSHKTFCTGALLAVLLLEGSSSGCRKNSSRDTSGKLTSGVHCFPFFMVHSLHVRTVLPIKRNNANPAFREEHVSERQRQRANENSNKQKGGQQSFWQK